MVTVTCNQFFQQKIFSCKDVPLSDALTYCDEDVKTLHEKLKRVKGKPVEQANLGISEDELFEIIEAMFKTWYKTQPGDPLFSDSIHYAIQAAWFNIPQSEALILMLERTQGKCEWMKAFPEEELIEKIKTKIGPKEIGGYRQTMMDISIKFKDGVVNTEHGEMSVSGSLIIDETSVKLEHGEFTHIKLGDPCKNIDELIESFNNDAELWNWDEETKISYGGF